LAAGSEHARDHVADRCTLLIKANQLVLVCGQHLWDVPEAYPARVLLMASRMWTPSLAAP
jgi:hypothetical protein